MVGCVPKMIISQPMLLLLLLAVASAVTARVNVGGFLAPGTVASFRYQATTLLTPPGTAQATGAVITATVSLESRAVEGRAGHRLVTLRLSEAHVRPVSSSSSSSSAEDKVMDDSLAAYPAVFELSRAGHVASLLLAAEEPVWAANIKRGIVSMLQLQADTAQTPPDNNSGGESQNQNRHSSARTAHESDGVDAPAAGPHTSTDADSSSSGSTRRSSSYVAVETDVLGRCNVQHRISTAEDGLSTLVEKTRALPQDCEYFALHHGATREADQHILAQQTTGFLQTTHRLRHGSGAVELTHVEFHQAHESRIAGHASGQATSVVSRGSMRLKASNLLPSHRPQRDIHELAADLEVGDGLKEVKKFLLLKKSQSRNVHNHATSPQHPHNIPTTIITFLFLFLLFPAGRARREARGRQPAL